jgi:hypothetical protein
MLNNVSRMVIAIAVVAAAGCTGRGELRSALTAPSAMPIGQAGVSEDVRWRTAGGTTLKETLSGAPIDGIVPEGEAVADMSQFQAGGSTILTVQVKKVNLPDGTSLTVALSFTPLGTITLLRGEGTLIADLGRFGVSRDAVEVRNGAAVVLRGAFFQ